MPDLLLAPAGTADVPSLIAGFPAVGEGGGAGSWPYEVRRELWEVSSLQRVRQCGRAVISSDGLVRVARVGGFTRVWGVASCGSPWVCPVCRMGWSRRRVGELELGSSLHCGDGGGLEFVTCTVPHALGDPLATVWDRLEDRWAGLLAQWWWKRAKAELGIVGMVRTVEVGWSPEGGWGPHVHALLWTERPWSEPARAAIFKRIGEWFKRRRDVGMDAPQEGVGTLPPPGPAGGPETPEEPQEGGEAGKIDSPRLSAGARGAAVRDAGATAQYMAGGPAKGGERRLFNLVGSAPALWREYEQASLRRHPIRWSPGLRERFGITGRSDRDPLPADHTVVRVLDRAEWRSVLDSDGVGALRIAARGAVHQGASSVHWTP